MTTWRWSRFQNALHAETGTTDWHRYDLRRTAAAILGALKVSPSTVVRILAHADLLKAENVRGAASHHLQITRVLQNTRDPQEEALDILAKALMAAEKS